jgi:Na+/proline symporter
MSSSVLLIIFLLYALSLFLISWFTSRKANDKVFYLGNRQSPWYVVAYGMIGATLSGVTFLSQPGWVGSTQFSYMMMVFGYVAGYAVIALILLPLYYRLNLISIYTYLEQRFGAFTYKTGASFFILSRGVGAALRLFLSVYVLDMFVFAPLGVPFWLVAFVSIMLVLLYSFRGGIRTIVWTDLLQTTFMLLSVGVTIYLICKSFGWSFSGMISNVWRSDYSTMMVTDWTDPRFFLKQFFSGIFITIAMTGLDQDMMQKNLSCRNLRDAQKNMFTFSGILVIVNIMFLLLGAMLYFYAGANQIATASSDSLFATVSIHHLGAFAGIVFLIGLIAAAYSSADGALTALTTSFCIDIIGLDKRALPDRRKFRIRYTIHFLFAMLFLLLIVQFKQLDNKAIIDRFFTIAGYTYGPLLGLYSFGLFTRLKVRDHMVPLVAIASPVITYLLDSNSVQWFNGYRFGFELLIVNGLITFAGLWLFRKPAALTDDK